MPKITLLHALIGKFQSLLKWSKSSTHLEFIKSERGTVESALVMIPTVILFLSVLQIAASVLGRGVAVNDLQGEISRIALYNDGAPINPSASIHISRIPLPGGGNIIVGKEESSIPKLTPLIINQDRFVVTGIAIDEN